MNLGRQLCPMNEATYRYKICLQPCIQIQHMFPPSLHYRYRKCLQPCLQIQNMSPTLYIPMYTCQICLQARISLYVYRYRIWIQPLYRYMICLQPCIHMQNMSTALYTDTEYVYSPIYRWRICLQPYVQIQNSGILYSKYNSSTIINTLPAHLHLWLIKAQHICIDDPCDLWPAYHVLCLPFDISSSYLELQPHHAFP